MRKRLVLAVVAVAALTAAAAAGMFWRTKVNSLWTAKPLPVDGDDSDWKESSAYEQEGLSVRAMNDADTLWVMVTAHTRDARDILTGESRQDVALWFLDAKGEARQWGVRLPYGRRQPLTTALRESAGLDPMPETLRWTGAAVSTEAWPTDMADRLVATGRRPVWEVRVPLSRLTLTPERSFAADLAVSAPSAYVPHGRAGAEDEGAKRRRERPRAPEDAPTALTLLMNVRLAFAPGTER